MILLLYMLYLEQCKLLKILILVSVNIKGYGICFNEGGTFSKGNIMEETY